jgi:hypothetical protein
LVVQTTAGLVSFLGLPPNNIEFLLKKQVRELLIVQLRLATPTQKVTDYKSIINTKSSKKIE